MSEHLDVDRLGEVKRLTAYVPVTAQQLMDAGLPLPPGMEPPPAPKPLPWRLRWRFAVSQRVWVVRERVGFWIAGHEPDEGDW